ncbi:MAG: succinate dehydrogenase, cytochrome b556 subunit [Zetaproteobacteria bacterium]|nr:succinate dehydrogenase, cytochrome b556 subunit [Zetaproteobacteria bacterium]
MTTHERPLSPRLSIYRWLPGMVASIAHRISGVLLILFVPFYLWLLHGMTGSPEEFQQSLGFLHSSLGKVSLWLVSVAVVYHFCNGIRFLCLDAGWGESRNMMRSSARMVLALAIVAGVVFGVLLW